jgi:penicillin-binding protein 1C
MTTGDDKWRLSLRRLSGKKWFRRTCFVFILFVIFLAVVPAPRFHDPYSTVLSDHTGRLLSARVAADEQWRFAASDSLPEKYIEALLTYEDRYFYDHPGVNPVSLAKAAYRNIRAGKIVSGGSTLTMQLARLARGNPPRTLIEKFWEILMAFKGEIIYSKEEILVKYAAHAPFGGNVVGLDAACWRFFGIGPEQISWAQAATLAVLPNSPALIFPGKNQEALKRKRDRLLRQMWGRHLFDSMTYSLAMQEPVPGPPRAMPQLTPELAVRLINAGQEGQKIMTTLDASLQQQVSGIIARYHELYRDNQIYNAAALVLDVQTGKALAYIGNIQDSFGNHSSMVDIITAPRSYGSLLKPILYMAALDDGKICPESLLPDYPASFGGFSPKNFNLEFDGVVPADNALVRSLNIPHVFLLQRYSTPLFLNTLRNLGLTTFENPATYYGLSLILGGGESNLWELTGAYAALAHRLSTERDTVFTETFLADNQDAARGLSSVYHTEHFHPSSIWTTFEVMTNLYRPGDNGHWEQFSSSKKIAWKTGTSFGNRDGWAIGISPRYAVGVWIGNASGEGRARLVGADCAAPVLFDIFSILPDAGWFPRPKEGWTIIPICRQSGDKASDNCPDTVMKAVPATCAYAPVCDFHKIIHLDPSRKFRVNSNCMDPADMRNESWFVLTPIESWYYRKNHSNYRPLPPIKEECKLLAETEHMMSLIYPSDGAKIYIPKEREGNRGKVVFEVADRDPNAVIYWHADDTYLGFTHKSHSMEINLPAGMHHFTLVDNNGGAIQFQVLFLD